MYRLLAKGVFWGVLASFGVIFAQLALTLIVGRQSSELLGLLNIIEVVNTGFMAFFFVGGGVSLTNFINQKKVGNTLPVTITNTSIACFVVALFFTGMHLSGKTTPYTAVQLLAFSMVGVFWLFTNQLAVDRAARFNFRTSNMLEKGANIIFPTF